MQFARSGGGASEWVRRAAWTAGILAGALSAGGATRADGASIEAEARALISKHGFREADVAIVILSDRGEPVLAIHADDPFQPASNQKVLTSAAGLSLLGAQHRYETTLVARVPIRDGVLDGDLIVRGTGDPNISSRFYEGGPATLFRLWARDLRSKGLREIRGNIVADDTYFDDIRLPPSWDARQQETWYSAQICALSLNDNCLDVTVRPADAAGKEARASVLPDCAAIRVAGAADTVAAGETRVIVHRKPGTNQIGISGQIRVRSAPWSGNVTMDDPALVFASALAAAFRDEGIGIGGQARKIDRELDGKARVVQAAAVGEARGGAEITLLRHTSTLLQDLPIILKRSQNLHAELLLKALGAKVAGDGSLRGGERAVRQFLKSKGIPAEGLVLSDGSGLSHENRVTARILARVLSSVRSESYFDAYLKALPVAGEDGTLEERFRGPSPVRGNLYAKTGYIRGVSCLSGYVVKEKRSWCFSVLVNQLKGGAHGAKALQESIGELIYRRM